MILPFPILLVLGLCLCSFTFAVTQTPPGLTALHVPLTASSDNQRYIANVNMSSGPQTQRFGFALSTTTGYAIVADTSCTSCTSNNIATYNSSLSTSAKAINSGQQQQVVHIAGGTLNAGTGLLSKDDCALQQNNGSVWQYTNQTIVQVNSSVVFQGGVSGLLGLGTNTASFQDTIFAGWLSHNPTVSNFTFGLALNPLPGTQAEVSASSSGGDPDDAVASAGTLHLQQPDPSSFTGSIQWQDVQNTNPATPATNGSSDSSGTTIGALGGSSWVIQMDGWNFTAAEAQTSNSQGGLAAVEPFFANIFLPQLQATQVYAALPGSQLLLSNSSDLGQSYSIPCDADISFTVILSGQGYRVPKEALVLQGTNGSCTGAIQGWIDESTSNYLLGSRFISTVYMVFQVGQPPSVQQKVGIAQRASGGGTKKHVGAIVGGVLGGIACFLIVGGTALWWVRRKRRVAASKATFEETQPFESSREKMMSPVATEHPSDGFEPVSFVVPTPEPYHTPAGTPSIVNSAFTSGTGHESLSMHLYSPTGNTASDPFLLPPPPKVKQWVTSLRPSANHPPRSHVSTAYDYGNDGEPGRPITPTLSDEHEGSSVPASQDSHKNSTQVALEQQSSQAH